jgi:hypothetical protein
LVEKSFKKFKTIYDANHLQQAIDKASAKAQAVLLTATDFREWDNSSSTAKHTFGRPRLSEVQTVYFKRGCTDMYYKASLNDEEYTCCRFLKLKSAQASAAGLLPQERGGGREECRLRRLRT